MDPGRVNRDKLYESLNYIEEFCKLLVTDKDYDKNNTLYQYLDTVHKNW